MSRGEVNLLYASILESKYVCGLRRGQKQHVWVEEWVELVCTRALCTILSGKHHRHRIMSRYGTEQQKQLSIVFSHLGVARKAVGGGECVLGCCAVVRGSCRRWVAGLAELSTYPVRHLTYFYFLALLRIVLASPLLSAFAGPVSVPLHVTW